ncbi:MAG: hypothetical protein LKH33_11475 [Acetobacter sp.]|jgi:hypothetical protein|nr:hypothetical protein [Acetobacter sp.]MCH4060599.1 hypothetical protein [Acetobacter sp.]MCH4087539.1 hypothetical protein [Acetobacter sp.]MCI1294931.1 hypothetical protein [Acetobacter sp.]MCI1321537.1 hypothetical protein [Acetobacter sp.]
MAVVTIQGGAEGQTVNVTVDGAATGVLGSLISRVNNEIVKNFDDMDVRTISSSGTTDFSGAPGYGVLTTDGSYAFSGNVSNISFGEPSGSSASVSSANFTIDITGVTASNVTVTGGTTGNTVLDAGASGGLFISASGDNLFNGDTVSSAGSWEIWTGAGNDTINAGSGVNTIYAGAGENSIILDHGYNRVFSQGQDSITGSADRQNVFLSGGSSYVSLSGSDQFVADASYYNTISLGAYSTVSGGAYDTISATTSLIAIHTETSNISVDGALSFLNGSGETTITASASSIFGSSNLNVILNASASSSSEFSNSGNLFVANEGNETLNASGSAYGVIAWGNDHGYTGTQVLIGGSASDTLVAGVGDSTMTGGSGDSNMFDFLNGRAGASYTITDFNAADGNKVWLANYGNDAVTNALSTQQQETVNGVVNTTITLSDNSQITFVGVDQLKTSDFL